MKTKNGKRFERCKADLRVCAILEESRDTRIEHIELKIQPGKRFTEFIVQLADELCTYVGEMSRSLGERLKDH